MPNLHLVSTQSGPALLENSIENIVLENDADSDHILLIGDGVLTATQPDVLGRFKNIQIMALEADVQCRGIASMLHQSVKLINDKEMVKLCASSKQVVSW